MSYATLAEVKATLTIEYDDNADDTALNLALTAAAAAIDDYTQRTFVVPTAATARYYEAPERTALLYVDDIASLTGFALAFSTDDGQTFTDVQAASTYRLKPANALAVNAPVTAIETLNTWPYGANRLVQVTARYGWPAVPAPVKQAHVLLTSRLFHRYRSPEGVLSFTDMGALRLPGRDPDVTALLAPYRKTTASA